MRRLLLFIAATALCPTLSSSVRAADQTVREPAVAGLFYPRDPAVLAGTIDRYLADAHTARHGELRALICPHAGYPYSGPVAAKAFALLRGTDYRTVIVLGPAHYAALKQASVSGADLFRTPLGDVPISAKARQLGASPPFALDPRCYVERPEWADQSSRPPPAAGAERADTWEHSDEVEVPFLQRTLTRFDLVPVVMGETNPAAAAKALGAVLDNYTLLVVSSDLSHYHSYAEARRLDERCVNAICQLDVGKMADQEACGRTPILTLMHVAKERGWQPQLLDLRNSGDTAGDKSRVVGYTAIAFYEPAAAAATTTLTPEDRKRLLSLARQSVRESVTSGRLPPVPADVSPRLAKPSGTFVTLTKHGELRGCIGHIIAQLPLVRAVAENARSAALQDPRFPPVSPRELDDIDIEISVLTNPEPVTFTSPDDLLRQLRPNVDGVVLRTSAGVATYLPQVWEQLPDKTEFLDSLARKAGGRPGDWRQPGTSVSIYHVESFKEP